MENNKELKTNRNGLEHLPTIGANPPRTRPPKAKTQIASALFRPRSFWLSRSCAYDIWGACGLCFISFFTFQYRICDISHLRYISHMRYCKCEIMTSKYPLDCSETLFNSSCQQFFYSCSYVRDFILSCKIPYCMFFYQG